MANVIDYMQPVITGWLRRIEQARKARRPWDDVSNQCMEFYRAQCGFMWDEKYRMKYFKGKLSPKFRMTVAKAFEFVALYAPSLYWANARRFCRARDPVAGHSLTPGLFGPPGDQMAEMMFQQAQFVRAQDGERLRYGNSLMEMALNYMPTEQPDGGLVSSSELAVIDSLITGRGCLESKTYDTPGSPRRLAGSFRVSPYDVFVSPDSEGWDSSMQWMAIRRRAPQWRIEQEFNLPQGTLDGVAGEQSQESIASMSGTAKEMSRLNRNESADIKTYYEIFSKSGFGHRLSACDPEFGNAIHDVLGDYVRCVVAEGVPFFLNAPSPVMANWDDESAKSAFEWPTRFWKDHEWPVSPLDYYRVPDSAYPLPPLSPGLGELIFMNVMMSHLANRIWSSSRDIVVVFKDVAQNLLDQLRGGSDLAVVQMERAQASIKDMIQFVQHPPTNADAWTIMEVVSRSFEKRVGMDDLLYGIQGTQSRSAADISIRRDFATTRSSHMRQKVNLWQTAAARKERQVLHANIRGADLAGLVDSVDQHLWDQIVASLPEEIVMREMQAGVVADSMQRPDQERMRASLMSMMQAFAPEFSKHADVTTDTGPINDLLRQFADLNQLDPLQLGPRMPPPPPPPPPEVMQMQQAMQQLDMQGKQLDVEGKAIDVQGKQLEVQVKQAEVAQAVTEAQSINTDVVRKQAEQEMDLLFSQQDHQLGMMFDQDRHALDMDQAAQEAALKIGTAQAMSKIAIDAASRRAASATKPPKNKGDR